MVESLVLGLGKSGVAATATLLSRGESLILSDVRSEEALRSTQLWATLQELEAAYPNRIEWALGGHPLDLLERVDRVIVSPGVSLHTDFLKKARLMGRLLIGEMELAWSSCAPPMIAVTGTNGKSTTCTLLGLILGERAVVGGNIGTPLLEYVGRLPAQVEWVVAEVSSFQLETVHRFHPRIGILTNITPDHLDHHRDLQEYYAAKSRMFAQMQASEVAIFCADDEGAMRMARDLQSGTLPLWLEGFPAPLQVSPRILTYSVRGPVSHGVALTMVEGQEWVTRFDDGKQELLFPWDFPGLPGEAMKGNGLASILGGLEAGASLSQIQEALRRFQPLHYRMELTKEVEGVKYLNDSKATNIASALSSVRAAGLPLCVIVGGKDKGVDYSELALGLADSGARVFLIGEAATPIGLSLEAVGYTNVEVSGSLEQALPAARHFLGSGGGTVLLAPACSSFDQFRSAEHRGEEFDRLVKAMAEDWGRKAHLGVAG